MLWGKALRCAPPCTVVALRHGAAAWTSVSLSKTLLCNAGPAPGLCAAAVAHSACGPAVQEDEPTAEALRLRSCPACTVPFSERSVQRCAARPATGRKRARAILRTYSAPHAKHQSRDLPMRKNTAPLQQPTTTSRALHGNAKRNPHRPQIQPHASAARSGAGCHRHGPSPPRHVRAPQLVQQAQARHAARGTASGAARALGQHLRGGGFMEGRGGGASTEVPEGGAGRRQLSSKERSRLAPQAYGDAGKRALVPDIWVVQHTSQQCSSARPL